MRKGTIVVVIVIIAILGFVGYDYRHEVREAVFHSEAKAVEQAQKLLSEGNAGQALTLLQSYGYEFGGNDEAGRKWREVYLEAVVKTRNGTRAVQLYQYHPTLFADNEEASLIVADQMIKSDQLSDYDRLRQQWVGRETKKATWFVLDADSLLLQGKRDQAVQFLSGQSFEGKEDVGRLIRLALLTVKENPQQAWDDLAQAAAKDPGNTEIILYKARLLEALDKTPLALNEYLAAVQAAPTSVFVQDQLAEFYRRHNRYDLALKIWKDLLTSSGADWVWLKAWFWSHIVLPLNVDWAAQKPKESGSLAPLINYLAALKPGTFWDNDAFGKLPNAQRYLETQQVTFWLRLLNNLQHGEEAKAWELLQYNGFGAQSWNPGLEVMLRKVLTYRKIGSFSIDVPVTASENVAKEQTPSIHPFYTEVAALTAEGSDQSKISPQLKELLQSKLAIPSTFLASGWLEAALTLSNEEVIPSDMPDWVAYGFAQAIRQNRGVKEALAFANRQTQTSPIEMFEGELLIAEGNTDAGAEKLKKLATTDTEVGLRSAWILSLLDIEKGKYDDAQAVVDGQPRLAQQTIGKEVLARIALLKGDQASADKLYTQIAEQSAEAKSYFAKKAFIAKDWKKARELTQALLQEYPNSPVLKANLDMIEKEQTSKKGE